MSEAAMALPEHEVEAKMEKRGRDVMRHMLQAHMNRRGTGNVGLALRVVTPEGEVLHEEARVAPHKIVSIFGDVKARRTAFGPGPTVANLYPAAGSNVSGGCALLGGTGWVETRRRRSMAPSSAVCARPLGGRHGACPKYGPGLAAWSIA